MLEDFRTLSLERTFDLFLRQESSFKCYMELSTGSVSRLQAVQQGRSCA